jgi:eukaryotic-like serine/threonine-protein kinase
MATQIGRFEILSEIAKSDRACVYKANDSTNGQTVALKALRLDMPAEQAQALIERVQAEADTVNGLNSPNIALLYGAGEIDNLLCAAMEYVQGNSIATMLARREGFSIWDLLDISRQVCQGFDHAHSKGVVHYSLEPAKVMVTWDGTVKILSFGISMMGMPEVEGSGKPRFTLHYASPEQLRGEAIDPRSNFFSWGAILYEMVSDQKPFDGDSETVRRKILEENPVPPAELNRKIHPAVSDLIMMALSKAPDERFQNGQQLVMELEKCKQASAQAAAKKSSTPAQGLIVPNKVSPGSKSTGAAANPATAPPTATPVTKTPTKTPGKTAIAATGMSEQRDQELPAADLNSKPAADESNPARTTAPPIGKAAAAAGGSSPAVSVRARSPQTDKARPATSAKVSAPTVEKKQVRMSAAAEQTAAAPAKKYAVDPMMAEDGPGNKRAASFSELEEMPPLKEVYVAPPEPAAAPATPEPAPSGVFLAKPEPPKSKVPPRVVARQAVKEITSVPPRLMMYSVAAAIGLVLVIAVGLIFHIHSQNTEEEGTPVATAPPSHAEPIRAQTAAVPAAAVPVTPEATAAAPEQPAQVEVAPVVKPRSRRRSSTPVQVASVPGQLSIDSTPQGAQVQIDGHTDIAWVTPFAVAGVAPGRHIVSIAKNGYTAESKTVEVASGSKSFVVLHLAQASGTLVVHSDPPGAAVFVDGKDTGHVTPMQVSVERGSHVLLVRKQGYLDETISASPQPGQSFRFSPTLKPLGNVDDIRTVGKFKKIFGGGEGSSEMGTVSIKTQPKGAQIAVNRRMLDKSSPVQFMAGPGNYIIDITATGYKPIHRVVTVEKGVKVALEETMQLE